MIGGYVRNTLGMIFGTILCLSLGGCDALYRMLDKPGAEEKALLGEIIPHEKNTVVETAQALLSLYGYNPGEADGLLGLKTRNAIENFQKDNGLVSTRFIDKATWKKLNVFVDNGLVVDRQLNMRLIQTILKTAGFDPGEADGKMGAQTKEAVLKFQKAKGLKIDGKAGYQTLNKLAELISPPSQIK